MRPHLARSCLVLVLALAGCVHGDPFAIGNQSSRALTEVRLAPVAERAWEDNLIAPLGPGELVGVAPIACTYYDVLIVDGRGARCVLPMQRLCFHDEPWLIDDTTLAPCRWVR